MAWISHQVSVNLDAIVRRAEEFSNRTKGRVVVDCYDNLPGYGRIYFEKTGKEVSDIMAELRVLGFDVRRTKRK